MIDQVIKTCMHAYLMKCQSVLFTCPNNFRLLLQSTADTSRVKRHVVREHESLAFVHFSQIPLAIDAHHSVRSRQPASHLERHSLSVPAKAILFDDVEMRALEDVAQ